MCIRDRTAQRAQQRGQLTALVRAAYQQGEDAPLKVLLSQDRVADANRLLAYHRYVQRDQTRRIDTLTTDLAALDEVEREIATRRTELEAARARQRGEVVQLEKDRKTRASLVADLDERYQDRAAKEKALGQDARSLETLLKNLRAAAARAEAERRAAAKKREGTSGGSRTPRDTAPRPVVASAPALKVGGLGWPVSGSLLARPSGRRPP